MDLLLIMAIMLFLFTVILSVFIRVDYKTLQKEKLELCKAWSDYYAEKRKFREIDKVLVLLRSGRIVELEEVKYYAMPGDSRFITFYDENEKAIKIIDQGEVEQIDFIRKDQYVSRERVLGDDH